MTNFTQSLQAKLQLFTPFLDEKIEIHSTLFTLSVGKVANFLVEIEQTSSLITQQTDPKYVEIYAQKLVQQFDLLKSRIGKYQRNSSNALPTFKSNYRFAKNLANLPACKRREEYQKALRALNEKISWLIAQSYQCSAEQKKVLEAQIQETEYRKQKCLKAIDELGI